MTERDTHYNQRRAGARIDVAICTDRAAWNGFVGAAGGSLLQSWQWGEFRRRQGWRVLRLVALDGGDPCGAMQVLVRTVRPVGSFFYAAEGPVLPTAAWATDAAPLAPLLTAARRIGRAGGALTLRLDPLTSEPHAREVLRAQGLRRGDEDVQPPITAVVDLDAAEDVLLARLEKGARYLVRRAQRDGVVVRPGTGAQVPLFARMVAETGRRKGFGVRDEGYLHQLADMVQREDSGEFLIAEFEGAMVGGLLTGTFGARSMALYAASDDMGRKVNVQYALHWHALLRAKRWGCRVYDLRGIGASDDPADHWGGMTFFKQRFGTRREEHAGTWDDIYRPVAYRGFRLAQRARRTRPLRASRLLRRVPT